MMRRLSWCGLVALAALVPLALPAQAQGIEEPFAGYRNRDGTINYAPRPSVYTVEAVDSYARIVRLRASDGTAMDVQVPDRAPEIESLAPGDEVRVDFFVPRPGDERLTAAKIWPMR